MQRSSRRLQLAGIALAVTSGAWLWIPLAGAQSAEPAARAPEREIATVTRAFRIPRGQARDFGMAPAAPDGAQAPELAAAIDTAFGENLRTGAWGDAQEEALRVIARSRDPRAAWIVSDLMRVVSSPRVNASLVAAAAELLGIRIDRHDAWGTVTDHLIAWDIPAPPGYLDVKRRIYTLLVPEWERLFVDGDIDWRHVSWGGVGIDDRPFGATDAPCNCIPAADDPPVSDAAGAGWLADGDVIFGIGINGQYRAYPRRIMEVREIVNDTLGGRHLGVPYCTLCGSAQAYLTDAVPAGVERPVLRTSGLLIRSNKIMFDVNTWSVFDTFRGHAVTGPLGDRGVVLKQIGVVTATWGEWRKAHPDTTVLVEALALGRDFDFRNTRDANGPIFPIGDVDPRLPVHEDVLGVVTVSGTPIAFHVRSAREALARGESVTYENVRLVLDGGGVRAVDADGKDLGGHQAFWFAWSQFHPGTRLWPPAAGH